MKQSKAAPNSIPALTLVALPAVALFLYFFFRIRAELFYQVQTPVFFFDSDFFREFLTYPGGLLQVIAQFLEQFFYYGWTGALLLALLLIALPLLVHRIVKVHICSAPIVLSLLTVVPFFFIYHHYAFSIAMLVGVEFALFFFLIYLTIPIQNNYLRIVPALFLFAILYWIATAPAIFFSMLVIVNEIIRHRNLWTALLFLAVTATVPLFGSRILYILPLESSYLLNSGWIAFPQFTLSIIIAWLLVFIVLLFVIIKSNTSKNADKPWPAILRTTLAGTAIQMLIFFLLLAGVQHFAYQPKHKKLLQLDYFCRHHQWDDVLDLAQRDLVESNIVNYQINRALYFTGRLNEALFYFPQKTGKSSLFVDANTRPNYPLQYSDIFWDLSLINEAQHWAHEALSVNGDNPWILQRLALVYILKDEYAAARKYLLALKKTMWFNKWAEQYLHLIDDAQTALPQELAIKKQLMPKTEFLISPVEPELMLEELLDRNPRNHAAFEYFMAYCLLEGKVRRMMKYVHILDNFQYQHIPRHIEEAILLYMVNVEEKNAEMPTLQLSRKTYDQFQQVMGIMQKHNGNKNAAFQELGKYNDTYWYYATFIYQKNREE